MLWELSGWILLIASGWAIKTCRQAIGWIYMYNRFTITMTTALMSGTIGSTLSGADLLLIGSETNRRKTFDASAICKHSPISSVSNTCAYRTMVLTICGNGYAFKFGCDVGFADNQGKAHACINTWQHKQGLRLQTRTPHNIQYSCITSVNKVHFILIYSPFENKYMHLLPIRTTYM